MSINYSSGGMPKHASRRMVWVVSGLLLSLLAGGVLFWLHPAKPQTMQLTMSANGRLAPPAAAPADALTIILVTNEQRYYYFGPNLAAAPPALHLANSAQAMHKVLIDWQQQHKSTVFVKLSPQANYQQVVDMLDELNSIDQKKYALTTLSDADRQLLPPTGQP